MGPDLGEGLFLAPMAFPAGALPSQLHESSVNWTCWGGGPAPPGRKQDSHLLPGCVHCPGHGYVSSAHTAG